MEEETEETFTHYTPQHPLPSEIQNLTRDKTVCKYCGVSYLIHNEIKALEKKLKATEEELAHYKGLEKREALLQREILLLKEQLEESKSVTENNTKLMALLSKENGELKTQNTICEEKLQTCSNKHLNDIKKLSAFNECVKYFKHELILLQENFSTFKSSMLDALSVAFKSITQILEKSSKDTDNWESKLQCIEMEKMVVSQSNKSLSEALKNKESELQRQTEELNVKKLMLKKQEEAYRTLEESMKDVTNKLVSYKEVQVKLLASNRELEEYQTQCRILTVELDQYKIHLKSKTSELNEFTNEHKQIEHNHELALQKLHAEIKSKENDLGTYLKQIKSLESQCHELQKKEQEITKWSNMSSNEVQELKEEVKKAKADVDTLKSEREMMIEAHQNRIEELRESFKNKMAEAEGWPQKLQTALSTERGRHLTELKTLEENLKHQFVLELQIEKDKYDELMKKFQGQEKDKNNLKENHRALIEQKYQDEIEDLHRKLTESKRRFSEREEELTKEISSLKKIINDLQDRSAKLDGSDSVKINELQIKLSQIHQEHLDSLSQITLLKSNLKETTEEAQFLQGVVRKECEERFELTEALSEARRELLQLKKPTGGYSSVQKRGSTSSINSNSSTQINSPVTLTPIDDPLVRSRASVHSYNGAVSGNEKTDRAMLQENRKRISSMMGRR